MNRETQIELVKKLDASLIDVLVSKGADYATGDVLSNFKRISAAAEALDLDVHTSWGYSLFMVLLKIDRINNLLSSFKKPNNESIEDSVGDALNYLKLSYLCIVEDKKETEELKQKEIV